MINILIEDVCQIQYIFKNKAKIIFLMKKCAIMLISLYKQKYRKILK